MISNFLHYQFALASLLFKRDINFLTWRYAAWNRPVVVCGRHGAWVVDSAFDMTNAGMRVRALVQFFVGMLMIAGAVGWLANELGTNGFYGAATVSAIKAAILIGIGLVVALDAAVSLHPIERSGHADAS